MLLLELMSTEKTVEDIKKPYEDNTALRMSDTRKTRLTFEQLSKLRKLSDLKATEYQESISEIRRQFAPAPAAQQKKNLLVYFLNQKVCILLPFKN